MDLVFVLRWPYIEFPVSVIALGCIVGLSYSVLAAGLVLVYRVQRIVNLAHAQLGAVGAATLAYLVLEIGLPWPVAFAGGLAISAGLGVAVDRTVLRRLVQAPRVIVLVATIGLAQVFALFAYIITNGISDRLAGYPLPFASRMSIGEHLVLTDTHLLILRLIPPAIIGVALLLRFTNLGLAIRASAENRDAARLAGIPIQRVTTTVWALAGALAALTSISLSPDKGLGLTDALGPELLIRALAAAVIARMTSLGIAFAAGIGIGVLEQLVFWNTTSGGVVELSLVLMILVAFGVQARLDRTSSRTAERSSWELSRLARPLRSDLAADPRVRRTGWAAFAALVAGAAVLPYALSNSQTFVLHGILTLALLALSLVILTGASGQISLGQVAFLGLGASVSYQLATTRGLPFLVALAGATVVGALAAVVIGLPALRIRGLFLAVTTLGFAIVGQKWLIGQDWMGGVGARTPRPEIFGISFSGQHAYYLLVLAAVAGAIVVCRSVLGGPIGRTLVAVRDNEYHAAALGVDPTKAKVTAFAISGAIAALAGALYGAGIERFSPENFPVADGLRVVSVAVIGGLGSIPGAIVAAIAVFGVDRLVTVPEIRLLGTSMGLLLVILFLPGGLAHPIGWLRDRIAQRLARGEADAVPEESRDLEPVG